VGDVTDILLVSHDPHDSDQLLWALEAHGLARRTKVMRDANEAIDHLLSAGSDSTTAPILLPRLILIDISSLSSPGVAALRRIKTNAILRAIPTVVLTRSVDQATDIELIRAGANSVVARPREAEKLRDIMGHVVLYWMLVNRPLVGPAPPHAPLAPGLEATTTDEQLKILIADATFQDAEPAIDILESSGYRMSVEVATQPEEFVNCLTDLEYDVIVSEATLPGWDLTDAATALAKSTCPAPLIVLTSAGSVDGMRQAFQLGALDYIHKDQVGHLPNAVARVLEHRRAPAQEGAGEHEPVARPGSHALLLRLLLAAWDESNPATTIEATLREVTTALSANASAYFELQPREDLLRVQAGIGWSEGIVGCRTMEAYAGTVLGFALGQQAPVLVANFATDHRFTAPPLLADHRIQSGLCVTVGGDAQRDVGVFGVFSQAVGHFTPEDAEFIGEVGRTLTSVLRRSRAGELPQLLESVAAQIDHAVMIFRQEELGEPEALYVNPAFTRLTGIPQDDMVGTSPHSLLRLCLRREDRATILRSLRRDRQYTGEIDVRRRGGSMQRTRVRIAPIGTPSSEPTRWVVEGALLDESPPARARPTNAETILLVEQEETVRSQVTDILTKYGYTVLAASSATEAVTRASAWKGRLDLVLTELTEPGISGPKLVEEVRAQQPEVNVLFISKYRDLMLALPDMPEERIGWLHKPFPDEVLLATVKRLLAIRQEEGNHER
jgi:PAS domain S-box-containing protein